MSVGPATVNADLQVLCPEVFNDIGKAVRTKLNDYDGGEKKRWTITFEAGELCTYNPEWEGASINRSPENRSKNAIHNQLDEDPLFKRWAMDVLTILGEFYAEKVIQWKTLCENTPSVPPAKLFPQEYLTKMFQRCLIHKEFEQAQKYLKMGADPKKYIGDQDIDNPWYCRDRDKFPESTENANVLHWACERPCLGSLKFLKEIGVWDLTSKDIGDRTPFHYLMTGRPSRGFPEIRIPMMKIILDDPQVENIVNALTKRGNTPINCMLFEKSDHYRPNDMYQIIEALLEYSPVKIDVTTLSASTCLTPSDCCAALKLYKTASIIDSYKGPTRAPAKPALGSAKPAVGGKLAFAARLASAAKLAAPADVDDMNKMVADLAQINNAPAAPLKAAPKPPTAKPAFVAKPAAPVALFSKPATPSSATRSDDNDKQKRKLEILQQMMEAVVREMPSNPFLNKMIYELRKIDKE